MALEGIPIGAEGWRIAWPVALEAFEKLNKEDIAIAVQKLESQMMDRQWRLMGNDCCWRREWVQVSTISGRIFGPRKCFKPVV